MKKANAVKLTVCALLLLLVLALVPSFVKRVKNENGNDRVVVSLYYNDLHNRLTKEHAEKAIEDFKKIGVNTASISEENINSMVARGDVTNIKYNVLRHKYDDESVELAKIIEEKYPEVSYDAQLLITKDKKQREFLVKNLPLYYADDEYVEIDAGSGISVFCLYDGTLPTSDVILGYDEDAIRMLAGEGFELCLILKVEDYGTTGYLDNLERLVRTYPVKYLSIRKSVNAPEKEDGGKQHTSRIADLIHDNGLTLVVTENPDQLSNEKPFGYADIFNKNSARVLRSYETYDASNADPSHYLFRYQQYLNSTIDRNIRFITLSQIHQSYVKYDELNEYTLKAAKTYIEKIRSLGYRLEGEPNAFDYTADRRVICAIAAAILVLLVYLTVLLLWDKAGKRSFIVFLILAALAAGGTLVLPSSLLLLYPTAWAVLMPCAVLTIVFAAIRALKEKLAAPLLALSSALLLAALMCAGGFVTASLLSGVSYYINNDIFRGIKLSLFVPVLFAVFVYYRVFLQKERTILGDVKTVAMADIKVYWIAIAAVIGIIGLVYIRRSGNVNTISSLETTMRNFITDHFAARPRTKEFLVGYPCLVLFAYYVKKHDIPLLSAMLAAGSGIVAASISNSFCHVFTDVRTIYGRVFNGLILGLCVSVAVYAANLLLVLIVTRVYRSIKTRLE